MNRLWLQIVGVCWSAVFIWLVAFALFPSRDEVARSLGPAASAVPAPSADRSAATSPRPPASPSTTEDGTPKPCRNSYEPSCGQFRWDPTPTNRPMTVEAEVTSGSVEVGETTVVRVTAKDDTAISEVYTGHWGDDSRPFGGHGDCIARSPGRARYGPWTPPDQEDDTYTFSVDHVYDRAGTYEFLVQVRSGEACVDDSRYPNPYGDVGRTALKIVVSD